MVGPDNRTQPPLSGCTQNTKKTIGGKARSSSSSLCVCFQISLMTARMPSISGLTQNKKENHPRVFSLSDSLLLLYKRREEKKRSYKRLYASGMPLSRFPYSTATPKLEFFYRPLLSGGKIETRQRSFPHQLVHVSPALPFWPFMRRREMEKGALVDSSSHSIDLPHSFIPPDEFFFLFFSQSLSIGRTRN